MEEELLVIIMAGGLGSRMNSDIPKVIHKLNGIPLIVHILNSLEIFSKRKVVKQIFIVVGKYKEIIKNTIEQFINLSNITYIEQKEPLGTGHAIMCCTKELENYYQSNVMILSGDVPLFSVDSMTKLTDKVEIARITTTELLDPTGYGRVIMRENKFIKIIEHNECSNDELKITKVNCGIYVFNIKCLLKWLPYIINNNAKGEYYLTDIIELIKKGENMNIETFELPSERQFEIAGINTIQQLNELEFLTRINCTN
jgi:UDP-N-acetylglucosamine diphosphorylase/glucosamine-1-phosphate N-acetyltransferase